MIQLLSAEGKILYEVEKSALFPNYRSVLQEALVTGINLDNLKVVSENLDGLLWKGVKAYGISLEKCSLQNCNFEDCELPSFFLSSCSLNAAKFKDVNMVDSHWTDSNFTKSSFSKCHIENTYPLDCNFKTAKFLNSTLPHTCFHTCELFDTLFQKCKMRESSFLHATSVKDWLTNTTFIDCYFEETDMRFTKDISMMKFWNCNMQELTLEKDLDFVEIINTHTRVLYCIDYDTLWWKPTLDYEDDLPVYRFSLEELVNEIENDFPQIEVWPSTYDVYINDELENVCKYLKILRDERLYYQNKIRPDK